jgi:predicted Zn-dependent peptidase
MRLPSFHKNIFHPKAFFGMSLPLLASALVSFSAFAQSKKAPYDMTIGGVKVIVQPSGNEIVEIRTLIKGGVQNYPAGKAGIESLAMNALTECGTANDSKNSFKDKLDKVSAQMSGDAGRDYSSLTMNCIRSDFATVWPLYVDALTTPKFDEKEFQRIQQDAINNLKAQASQPDYSIDKMAHETAFAGRDYAKSPEGTEATVTKLTVAETKAYYHSVLTRSRLLIVIVGEIDKPELAQKIGALLAAIPAGAPFSLKRERFDPTHNSFKAEKKDLATNYIQGVTPAPQPGTPDFNAFSLAARIFNDRHFLEVRTNNGLSYAPGAWFEGGLSPTFNISVSTTNPDKYLAVLKALMEKTRKTGFTPEEVKNMKTTYLTGTWYRQETNGAQAAALASNEILHNNWRRAITLNDDLKKLSVEDVNRAFNKYLTHITWVYQGDPAKASADAYTQVTPNGQALPPSKLSTQKNK